MTGRATPSLSLGILAWIVTLSLGGWLSNTLGSEGPLPSWLQSAGVVATLLLFVAVLGNGILLQPLLEGKMEEIKRNVALRFMSVGAWSYLAAYAWLAFLALPGVRQTTVFTMTTNTTQSLLIFLFWGNILSGSVYALLPVSRNMGWPSHPALTWHFWFTSIGAAMMVSGYALAGIFQGLALNDPGVPMGTVASYLRPFLVVVLIGQILWWAGQMAFSSLLFSSLLKLFSSTAPMAVFPSENPLSTTR
jgi:cbb3-type cytochrome oxidase subunit 1